MADPRALAAALRGDAPQLPENRMLGVADYADVQPGYAAPGPMNAGPVHDFFANGGIAGLAGMTPAYQQIAENHAAADAAPDLKSKLHILADNPAAMAAGVDAPIRAYQSAPDSLMGFRRSGPNVEFEASNYPHTQWVKVTFPNGETHIDAIKGMNQPHAIERAYRNWDAKSVEPIPAPAAESSSLAEALRAPPEQP
jgi:hypothetical protein